MLRNIDALVDAGTAVAEPIFHGVAWPSAILLLSTNIRHYTIYGMILYTTKCCGISNTASGRDKMYVRFSYRPSTQYVRAALGDTNTWPEELHEDINTISGDARPPSDKWIQLQPPSTTGTLSDLVEAHRIRQSIQYVPSDVLRE